MPERRGASLAAFALAAGCGAAGGSAGNHAIPTPPPPASSPAPDPSPAASLASGFQPMPQASLSPAPTERRRGAFIVHHPGQQPLIALLALSPGGAERRAGLSHAASLLDE